MTGIVEGNDETTESVADVDSGVLSGKQLDEENSEKLDSGMDEEMTGTSPAAPDLNSDSEDEPVVIKKKTKKQMILDDDDDDTNDVDNGSAREEEKSEADYDLSTKVSKKKTVDEAVSAILDSDSEEENIKKDAEKTGDSSGEESDSLTDIIKKRKTQKKLSQTDELATESSQKKSQLFSSDLFDAEDSDSDNDRSSDNNAGNGDSDKSDSENSNADDEGFGEDMDPKLKAKLMKMKGAAKKLRRGGERKAKPKTESLMDLHSESQRLIRESQVVLPYHQPTPKPINDFLARAMKKQQEYKALKAGKEFKKPSVIQHVIANCSPAVINTPSQATKETKTDNPTLTPVVDSTKPTEPCDIDTAPGNKESDTQKPESNMELDDDELPDLDEDAVNNVKKTLDFDTDAKTVDKISTDPDEKESESATDESQVMEVDSEVQPTDKPNSEITAESTNKDTIENKSDSQAKTMSDNDIIAFMTEPCPEESSVAGSKEKLAVPEESPKAKAFIDVLPELKNVTPKLSGGPEAFIDFEDSSDTPKLSGMDKLKDRFLSHSKKKKTQKKAKDVDISIVEKETGPGDTTELKMRSITYHVPQEEENKLKELDKPGAKLLALKEQLQTRMRVKREEARQKRQEIYALENEEGFEEENEEEKLLDDDAEMSDKSDTDIEDDQFDAEFGEEEFEEEEEEEKVRNPFADDEADEDDDDFDPEKASNKGSDDEEIDSDEDDAPMKLQLDTSDDGEDSDLENPSQNVRSSSKKKHKQVRKLNISDDEESNISAAQPTDREMDTGSFKLPTVLAKDNLEDEDDELSPLSKHLAPTQTQKEPKRLAMTLAVEDSQDLYGNTAEPYTGMTYPAGDTQPSQGLNFMVEDSQSQMLDADGFFKVKSTTKKPTSASLGLHNINSTQDNMSELMGLCSGRFVEPNQDESKKSSAKQLFSDGPGSNQDESKKSSAKQLFSDGQDNVSDELLGLCSGFFPGDDTQKPKSQGIKRKLEDDEESNDSFALLSDNENHMDSDKDELEDNEENQCDEVDRDASRDSTVETKEKFRGFRGRITGKLRKEFVDEEAELSGSEYDSDEDLDLAEEDDIMELEAGDQDVTLTEEELRNQVGRAHLKETIDSDKREIMRLQEMYLPDGDLYSDGNGRMRRFRWKNMDDESQQDMFDGEGSEDEVPEEDADEVKWRMERFEREKFLQEEREKEENETGSQFFKLGKKFALKIKEPVTKPEAEFKKPQRADKKENTSPVKPMLRSASKRKGSFLTRSKEALAKIAERTKSSVNPNATRNSRNFVFQHVSPDKSEAPAQPKPEPKPAAAKKKPMQPPAKRQRTKTAEAKPGSSIFNILER